MEAAAAKAFIKAQTEMGKAPVPGCSGYMALADGRVLSFKRKNPITMRPIRIGQYQGFTLWNDDGKLTRWYHHRLICTVFHGSCPDGMECRHLDGDKKNNSAKNLAWGTKPENNRDKEAHGTAPKGEANPQAKLTYSLVLEMRSRRNDGVSYSALGKEFGVSTMTAFRAVTGRAWSHI